MKTFNWSILFGLLAAACASAQQMCDPDDRYYETPPTRYEGQGVAGSVTPQWLVDNAGWSYATPERIATEEAAAAQAAQDAEAARIAAKSQDLKAAENRFLLALMGFNAQFPAHAVTLADGFLQITAKIEASGMDKLDQLELGLKLRTLWDVVLFHGGRFGDVQWHEGVAP